MSMTQPQVVNDTDTGVPQMPPNLTAFSHIVEQYATDGAFLWLLRNNAMQSTLYTVEDIAELDVRIHGHLQGLRSAGELGWGVCRQQLEYEDSGEAFMAGVYAFQSADPANIQYVCEQALANTEMRKGLVSAMGWIDTATANYWIDRFLAVKDPGYRYLGLAACSVRRYDPRQRLNYLLADEKLPEQSETYSRMLRLIGEVKRFDLMPALNQGMASEHATVKFWAYRSAVLLGNRACVANLKDYVIKDNPCKARALELVFNVLPVPEARQWIGEISCDLAQNRSVIMATAILGDPHAIGWLIQQMQKPVYARLAGLAFTLITGIDLEQSRLHKAIVAPVPDTEQEDYEDAAEDIDSDLAWPDHARVKAYWDQHGQSLQIGQRYFLGQPVNTPYLKQVLKTGNQLQRQFAAIKLALADPDEPLHNTAKANIN